MVLGPQSERQADLMIGWAELPRSPGHAFYHRLQAILVAAGFDRFAEAQCRPYYAEKRGRPSLPPGRYFRMHLLGRGSVTRTRSRGARTVPTGRKAGPIT